LALEGQPQLGASTSHLVGEKHQRSELFSMHRMTARLFELRQFGGIFRGEFDDTSPPPPLLPAARALRGSRWQQS